MLSGVIEFIGYESEENFKNFHSAQFDETIDASGCSILPGILNSHSDFQRYFLFHLKALSTRILIPFGLEIVFTSLK